MPAAAVPSLVVAFAPSRGKGYGRLSELDLVSARSGHAAARLARLVWGQKVASSNPVAPTFFRNEPFGENVEGLSYLWDESCGS